MGAEYESLSRLVTTARCVCKHSEGKHTAGTTGGAVCVVRSCPCREFRLEGPGVSRMQLLYRVADILRRSGTDDAENLIVFLEAAVFRNTEVRTARAAENAAIRAATETTARAESVEAGLRERISSLEKDVDALRLRANENRGGYVLRDTPVGKVRVRQSYVAGMSSETLVALTTAMACDGIPPDGLVIELDASSWAAAKETP